jgi:hypothetical protein
MASMDIDKPLDELIAAKPRARRGGRGGRAPQSTARTRYAGAVPKAASQPTRAAAKPIAADASKVIISNLPADVTEAAVRVSLVSVTPADRQGPYAIYGGPSPNRPDELHLDRQEHRRRHRHLQEQGGCQQGSRFLYVENPG